MRARSSDGHERSAIASSTKDPLWYETMTLQTWLPPLELAPQIVLEVWDRQNRSVAEVQPDKLRSASFVGCRILSLRAVPVFTRKTGQKPTRPKAKMADARWMGLLESGTHNSGGEVPPACRHPRTDPSHAPPSLLELLTGPPGRHAPAAWWRSHLLLRAF